MTHLMANWPAPQGVQALTTTRFPGFSQHHYAANNLALHVEDNTENVEQNRQALINILQLPHEPIWLNQTHSTRCVVVENSDVSRDADAAVTRSRHFPLVIMTADCLPIVLCNQQGTEIAAIHAGWRGLANGIIENTLAEMHSDAETCLAWIGPAICGQCYETGEEVRDQFMSRYSHAENAFFQHHDRLHMSLSLMAEQVLRALGVSSVTQSNACTFEDSERYYSYRKQAQTGRIATLIWFKD